MSWEFSLKAWIEKSTPSVAVAIMIPPAIRPMVISFMAVLYLMSNSQAMSEPLHPPLPGIGSITKNIRKIAPQVSNLWVCLVLVLWKIFWRILSQKGEYLLARRAIIGHSHKIMATEIMFPSVAAIVACQIDRSHMVYPRGIANRSSARGRLAIPAVERISIIIVGILLEYF